jgi:hypothetical protein
MTYSTMGALCKAASIKELSDQTVTLTVSASPTPTTTEVAWDYENGFIVVTPAIISKYIYTGFPGTTSTCFDHCVMNHNPLMQPHPTRAPRGTYVVPPSTPVTQFTPASSCLAETNMWLVSDRCSLTLNPRVPPWLQCTHTVAGDPNPAQTSCYPGPSTVVSGTPTYYTGCPAGYTTANSTTYQPYAPPNPNAAPFPGVVVTSIDCCPSAFPSIAFTHAQPAWRSTTTHNGTAHTVLGATHAPRCAASGTIPRLNNAHQTQTLKLYSNGHEGRPGKTYDGASEDVWDAAARNTVYAQAHTVAWTVFHGTHTCFEASGCAEYFTYSYSNTMGPGIPVVTRTSAREADVGGEGGGEGGPASSSSTGAAAAARGDGRVGLMGVVVVVTVVVNVVNGGLV